MKFFNFEKEPKTRIRNYTNYGGEFVDDNAGKFNLDWILEPKENLPKFLYRGVKNKDSINTFERALNSFKKINDSEDSLVDWQTESISTTKDISIAFSYALEGEMANKLDLYFKSGEKIFQFLNQKMGRWFLDHYPNRFIKISDNFDLDIDWNEVKKEALLLLNEQIEIKKNYLNNYPNSLNNKEENSIDSIKFLKLINNISAGNMEFWLDGKPANVLLGYLFQLEPKEKVRVATKESVDNFMKHYGFTNSQVKPGIVKEANQKRNLTNLLKNIGYNVIDKNNELGELGFFNPEDLNPVIGLEIKIVNGKLIFKKHFLKT